MSELFSPLKIRGVEFKNRIFVSPMCQYSSADGMPNDWHLVHLGSRAVGGAGLVIAEATAVSPKGRITPEDNGLWNNEQTAAFKKITSFIKAQNCVPGIQLAHAGRKASTYSPWKGDGEITVDKGGWQPFAPSAIKYSDIYPLPKELSEEEIKEIILQFKDAAKRSIEAGFQVIELHIAHGYLIHEFLSPFSNHRSDKYGGSLENRCRFAIQIAEVVREVIPQSFPLFVRISSTDWIDGGWDIEQSVQFAIYLKNAGVDLIDCSSGGNVHNVKIPAGPGYQVPFTERIKRETGILTAAVGFITQPEQAEEIIAGKKADAVLLGREFLRNPYWPLHAAKKLNVNIDWPIQYARAK